MKLGDITLNHIRILKTVDQHGSFSHAARHLGYSQALISKKVKQLEKYFDCPLLTRTPGSVRLTNNGKRILAKATHIYDDLESLQQEIAAPINSLGDKIVIGISPFLSAVWFQVVKDRFSMCFPDKEIIHVQANGNSFTSVDLEPIDLIINNTSAYNEEHPCTRLKTYRFVLASFDEKAKNELQNLTQNQDIDFSNLLLLKEVKQELLRNGSVDKKLLEQTSQVDSYSDLVELLLQGERATIVPEFCTVDMKNRGSLYCNCLYDINEFGVYIHVPPFSELLIIAEGLVRSFRLDQDDEESSKTGQAPVLRFPSSKSEILRIGIQKNSLGQLIASYGVKYISNSIKASSLSSKKINDLSIYRNFEVEIYPYSSGEEMNKKMKKAELDICIMDDISLLNNGSSFFDGLNFYSKLIAIASYNLLGIDNSIVVPRKSNISSVEDLRGKKISTLFGSNSHRFITTLLEIYGIDVSDECFLYDEDPRTASNSLLNGSIDAHVCCKSYGFLLEEHNYSKVLDYDDYCIPKMPSLRGIVCRTQVIRENPEIIIAYLHDLIITNQWFLEDQINALQQLSKLTNVNTEQVLRFYSMSFGSRIDPTLKPQWSWLLKTLNRRLEGKYGIAKFDVDFWMDDYFIRLVYNALGLDYHFQQVGFSNDLSKSYFMDERFGEYMKVLNSSRENQMDLVEPN
jgi:molybdate transport repressor ModE-like protein